MQRDIRKYLLDIDLHIGYIDSFLKGQRDFVAYESDLATQYAVERALGIIGEAANQVRKLNADAPISSLNRIVGMRNLLIHAYDSLDNAIVWSILVNHLPTLQNEVQLMLKALDASTN